MANLRHKVIDGLVNPAVMSGLIVISGSVTIDSSSTATVTFAAKSVLSAMGMVGTAACAGVATVTNGSASVVFTAGATGNLQYMIIASLSEVISLTDAGTGNITIVPKP